MNELPLVNHLILSSSLPFWKENFEIYGRFLTAFRWVSVCVRVFWSKGWCIESLCVMWEGSEWFSSHFSVASRETSFLHWVDIGGWKQLRLSLNLTQGFITHSAIDITRLDVRSLLYLNQSINHWITWESADFEAKTGCADFEAHLRTQSINQPLNNMGVRRLWDIPPYTWIPSFFLVSYSNRELFLPTLKQKLHMKT